MDATDVEIKQNNFLLMKTRKLTSDIDQYL